MQVSESLQSCTKRPKYSHLLVTFAKCEYKLRIDSEFIYPKIFAAMLHRAGQFHYQLIHRFIFSEEFCKKVLFFDHRGRLRALIVCDLKLSCLSQFKRPDKIWIKKTLTLNIILCNMLLYLQVLINKKTSTKTKKNTSCNTVTDLQKVGLSSSSCEY
jgi:hypothetical protein